jgi:(1->4)-alpha-D-glucan 1-alpha-D-glucosylmutase
VLLALHTAVAAWPIEAERMHEYLVKSTREADLHTSWTEPDDGYEAALLALATDLADELLHDPADHGLGDAVVRILRPGWAASLALLAVRLTAPGVPDLYQGTVSFTYSLVDPDNRIEPDWDERRALVEAASSLDGPGAWLGDDVEAAKAVVITRTLAVRRRRLAAFGRAAGYLPLVVTGVHADRVLAFARTTPGDSAQQPLVVTVTAMRSMGSWGDTSVQLPAGTWRNVLADHDEELAGGTAVPVARWLDAFPVGVLDRTDA